MLGTNNELRFIKKQNIHIDLRNSVLVSLFSYQMNLGAKTTSNAYMEPSGTRRYQYLAKWMQILLQSGTGGGLTVRWSSHVTLKRSNRRTA